MVLLLLALPAAGCGTVANLAWPGPEGGGKTPFGGVRQDVTRFNEAASGDLGGGTTLGPGVEQHPQVFRMLLWAADLPFTLVGDLITWPYVKAYSFINQPTLAGPPILVAAPAVPPPAVPVPVPVMLVAPPASPAPPEASTTPAPPAPAEFRPQTLPRYIP